MYSYSTQITSLFVDFDKHSTIDVTKISAIRRTDNNLCCIIVDGYPIDVNMSKENVIEIMNKAIKEAQYLERKCY